MADEDFKLSSGEASRLKNAFQDEKFIKLFQDYVDTINSDENRKTYEDEILALEKQRGHDVNFVHPEPVYVLKFPTKEEKVFVNICKNDKVHQPTFERKGSGTECQIPVLLTRPRNDVDKKGRGCTVVDVMYHPNTLHMANGHNRFRNAVEETALSMVQEKFGLALQMETMVRLRMKYKGKAPSAVLRNRDGVCEPLENYVKKLIPEETPTATTSPSTCPPAEEVPKYTLKYRDIVDLQDYSLLGHTDRTAPKEIVVQVELPKVARATEVELDVCEKNLSLKSCSGSGHSYNLGLVLSYGVDKNKSRARFDQTKRTLIVSLPVRARAVPL